MKKEIRIIQIVISSIATLSIVAHLISPSLSIDAITLTLLVIAILPWLAPLFKTLEFPGGMKIEFQEKLNDTIKKLKKADLLSDSKQTSESYSFENIAEDDPTLVLAGLRIELERTLRDIAIKSGIITKNKGITTLTKELFKNTYLDENQKDILIELIHLLNKVVHGENVSPETSVWVLENGPKLINSLKFKGTNTGLLDKTLMDVLNNKPEYKKIEKAPEEMKCVSFIAHTDVGVHHIRSLACGKINKDYPFLETFERFIPFMKENPADQHFIICGCADSQSVENIKKSIMNDPQIRKLFRLNPTFHIGVLWVDEDEHKLIQYYENILD